MQKTLLTIAMATLCLNFNTKAQSRNNNIKPLSIGDTIPKAIWNMPLLVVNHPQGKKSITLNDYKGKLIILDFWGSYCAPCIKFLPLLDSIGYAHRSEMQVLPMSDFNNPGSLMNTLNRFRILPGLKCPMALADKQLMSYFPHKLVSHLVWINKQGEVAAITGSDYFTDLNVDQALSNSELHWTSKKDILDFDSTKPLLQVTTGSQPRELYYSTLTSNIPGIAPPSGTFRDSVSQTATTNFYNISLLNLCRIALDYRTGAKTDQFIMNVKDTARYARGNAVKSNWAKQNSWCYSIRLPLGMTSDEIREMVQLDIIRWLKVMGISVKKKTIIDGDQSKEMYIITEAATKPNSIIPTN